MSEIDRDAITPEVACATAVEPVQEGGSTLRKDQRIIFLPGQSRPSGL